MTNGLPGTGRWLEVSPERLGGWLGSFAERHGGLAGAPELAPAGAGPAGPGRGGAVVVIRTADGSVAQCHVPFPPLPAGAVSAAVVSAAVVPAAAELGELAAVADRVAAHARADRRVGVLLVRLGGYAAGVFSGPEPRLVASKVGSRLVHGRSAAGGQSQRRFARRREKQASEALAAAASCAAAVFGPYGGRLDAVVLGGDKRAMAGLAEDPRLRPYFELAADRFLTVPDPRLAVLATTPRLFRAIRIWLTETAPGG